RTRVLAALRGEPVDRVPLAFWLHNFATENTAAGLAAETLRLLRAFDWDYLKPQSRAQCFAEMWGLTYRPSSERATAFAVTRTPIAGAADLLGIEPADPTTGALGEQLLALRTIRAEIGPDTPIIWTVFAPIMVLAYLVEGGRERAIDLFRAEPVATERALAAVAETLEAYARLCLEAGADGLFYATNVASRELTSQAECRRLHRPFDTAILGSVASAPFNVLHVCGAGARFEEFADYPVTAFSWATVPGNPTLAEWHRRTGRAVVGGLPAKPEIASMTPEEIAARTRSAIESMDGRWLLLAPDCSVNPDTPETLFRAAGSAARDAAR
ncbi:MAG TPA: uroporphyrinogen decarboxylase family protein, partial [Candidatus Methylomirabilis sp.]|nr:uroporphyrinogen decarboxylase family protein [Candidatus Methylomirabilis sp.]